MKTSIVKQKDTDLVGKYIFLKDYGGVLRVDGMSSSGLVVSKRDNDGNFNRYSTSFNLNEERDYAISDSPYGDKAAYDLINSSESFFVEKDFEEDRHTTSLAISGDSSFETANKLRKELEEKRNLSKLAEIYAKRKLRELENISYQLEKRMRAIQKIIDAISLYLGANEDIVQLTSGNTDPGPLYIRQAILYMDEEYGDPRPNERTGQPGIDFQSVEDFDKWLIKNISKIMPESKCILAMKPSRQDRSYTDNAFINASIKENNSMTYLIIRNGENIYRIWTGISMGSRLFPTVVEMEKVIEQIEKDNSFDKDKAINVEYIYKRNVLIMQGLIDRTEILYPLPANCSLFKPQTYDGAFVLVRDDENILDDSRPDWRIWKKEINSKIGKGSRVLVIEMNEFYRSYVSSKGYSSRYKMYSPTGNYPSLPTTGVYQVVEVENHKPYYAKDSITRFHILYLPNDTVWMSSNWEYDPHERKKRVTFYLYPDDDFIFNYDQISLEDIEYYLNSRKDRSQFLNYAIILWNLRDMLLEERQKEKDFVKLVASRMGVSEDVVWSTVDWWKFKNKLKRSIASDDAKALRMIERKIARDTLKSVE